MCVYIYIYMIWPLIYGICTGMIYDLWNSSDILRHRHIWFITPGQIMAMNLGIQTPNGFLLAGGHRTPQKIEAFILHVWWCCHLWPHASTRIAPCLPSKRRSMKCSVLEWTNCVFFDIHLVNRKNPTLKEKWKENMVVDFFGILKSHKHHNISNHVVFGPTLLGWKISGPKCQFWWCMERSGWGCFVNF